MAEATITTEPFAIEDGAEEENEREAVREQAAAIVGELAREAEQRVGQRSAIEERWLEDLRQYHGRYDEKTAKALADNKRSKLFVNGTRPKTLACEARLADMLFPTDDRNYGIQPTPVPEMAVGGEQAAMVAAQAKLKAVESPEDPESQKRAEVADAAARIFETQREEADRRAGAMQAEIDDHLKECKYAIQCRDVISDACRIGTGILKGPVIGGRTRRAWKRVAVRDDEGKPLEDDSGQPVTRQEMVDVEDQRPRYWRVDPWNFFPTISARNVRESEGFFERHLMKAKDLRKLAKQPRFEKDEIRALLREEPEESAPYWFADLRDITGAHNEGPQGYYHVWEYHGTLEADQVSAVLKAAGRQDEIGAFLAQDDEGEYDPLEEINVIVWFCQGRMLMIGPAPLDSGDDLYSVYCLEEDDASIFGFGVPYMARDSQSALGAAWRMMMDNAGLAVGPQIVVNRDVVEPADNSWDLAPMKTWYRTQGGPGNVPAFETYNIDMHQAELANIIELSRQNMDEETSIPVIAQGEQGTHVTQTAHGMSLLMNAVNVVFRRMVKRWDDDMTTPNITRLYDWLMQFSTKEHIKGDFEVDARGTSVLLVKEMQTANIQSFLDRYSQHPVLGRYIKGEGVPALRALAQSMMMPADQLVMTDTEIEQLRSEEAQAEPAADPEMVKMEAELNDRERQREHEHQLRLLDRDTAMYKLAATGNIELEKLEARQQERDKDRASKERVVASEIAMSERTGKSAGGYV